MTEIFTAIFLLAGGALILLAAVGIVRMPDLYTRMQPATKAATLGVGSILMGVADFFGDLSVTTRALAAAAFVVLTAPVAAHMIARAGYFVGVPLWPGSVANELRGRYDPVTHECLSHAAGEPPEEKGGHA